MIEVNLLARLLCACGCRKEIGVGKGHVTRTSKYARGHGRRTAVKWNGNTRLFKCARCPDDAAWRPKDQFPRNKARPHGIGQYCHNCTNSLARADYAANTEAYKRRVRKSRAKRLDEWKRVNRESLRKRRIALTYDLVFQVRSKLSGLKNRSKRRGMVFDLTDKDIIAMYDKQKGRCAVSGRGLKIGVKGRSDSDSLSVDRIDSKKGYTKDNVRLVTWGVNVAMQDWGSDSFINLCRDVVAFQSGATANG